MAFSGLHFCILESILCLLTFIMLVLRLFLYKDVHGRLMLSDYFAIGAWFMFLVIGMQDWPLWYLGAFDDKINPAAEKFGSEHGLATAEDTVKVLKLYYYGSAMYYSQMYLAKASMLAFYHHLFPVFMVKLRIALWVTDVLTFLGWLSSLLIKLLACQPIKANWALGEGNCNTMLTKIANDVRWGPHCLTDLMIYLLPMFLLRHLKLSKWQKLGVALTFASGFICIAFACAAQLYSYVPSIDNLTAFLFSGLEQTWACIVICLPAMRILFQREARKRLRKRLSCPVSVLEMIRSLSGKGKMNSGATTLTCGTTGKTSWEEGGLQQRRQASEEGIEMKLDEEQGLGKGTVVVTDIDDIEMKVVRKGD